MKYLEAKGKPKKGDIVFTIDESFPLNSTSPVIKIRKRIIQDFNESGAFFQHQPDYEYFEFLFPTEEDALNFVYKK